MSEDEAVYAYTRTGWPGRHRREPVSCSWFLTSRLIRWSATFSLLDDARAAGASVELAHSNYRDDTGALTDAGTTLRPYEAKVYRIVK